MNLNRIPLQTAGQAAPPGSQWYRSALGFRPFFLLAGLSATLLMLTWSWGWNHAFAVGNYYGHLGWHAHEMLFGYAVAVVAGFLLTAVRNWTGVDTLTGTPLAGLALLWLAARLLPGVPGVPGALLAAVDLAFLPLLAVSLFGPLWRSENRVNRVFPFLLLGMAAANLLVHLQALGLAAATAGPGTTLVLNLLMLLIVLVGGRVLPFFTSRAVAGAAPVTRAWLESATFASLGALTLLQLAGDWPAISASLCVTVALTQFLRLAGWWHRGILRVPLLWVLHSAYLWLVVGFLLRGMAELDLLPASLALHAQTAGAIGVFTLGMMARVSLGHTGRPLTASRALLAAFVTLNLAVLIRVFGPLAAPLALGNWLLAAGLLWSMSFLLFLFGFVPILVRPRVDGRPG